jgi:DNA-directed RNA polymerase specialized sigma24 family protein
VTAVGASKSFSDQEWKRIKALVTAYAFKRTGKRSWDRAEDYAQSAMVQYLQHPELWDPARESLVKHLCKRVIGVMSNDWHRKRSSFEVAMLPRRLRELEVDDGGEPADEVLDRRRLAAQFRARLEERLAGDELALTIIVLMTEGIATPKALEKASGLKEAQVCEARRRIFYHAKIVTTELGDEMDAEDDDSPREDEEEESVR